MRVDIDTAQHDVLLLRDDRGNVVDNAQIVLPHHVKRNGVRALPFACPTSFDDAIAKALAQGRSVGATRAVNLDTATDRNEPKDVVTIDGVATTRQLLG